MRLTGLLSHIGRASIMVAIVRYLPRGIEVSNLVHGCEDLFDISSFRSPLCHFHMLAFAFSSNTYGRKDVGLQVGFCQISDVVCK